MRHKTGGNAGSTGAARRWMALLLGLALIGLFLFVVAPAAVQVAGIGGAVDAIAQKDIEAGAYFYTDVAKVGEAELYLRHSLQ